MSGIGWFSGGVTSAVAIKIMLDKGEDLDLYYFETGSHHKDHERFIKDCEKWYNKKINIVQNEKYKSVDDVISKRRYINGPAGALCTFELKKKLRQDLEKNTSYDFQVFGFEDTKKEINRAIRFKQQYPEAKPVFPLIEAGLSKEDCKKIVIEAGIKLPAMYLLGFNNSNCIGCVKGGKKYWGAIKYHFPEVFNLMRERERERSVDPALKVLSWMS